MAGNIPKNKKEAVIEAGRFLRNLFGGGGKKKITPLPKVDREYPMVPREVIERAGIKSWLEKPGGYAHWTDKVGEMSDELLAAGGIQSGWRVLPKEKALAAARKANQPVGKTQSDFLREYAEAGGINVPAGGLPDQAAFDRAIAKLKKRTRKATPAEAELIPKLNKDEFEAALKTQPSSKAALAKKLQQEKDRVAREGKWHEEIEQELDVLGGFGGPEQAERWYMPVPPTSAGWKNKNDMKRAYTARILGNDPTSPNYKSGYDAMAAKVKARRAAEKQAQSFNEAVEEQLEFDFGP